MRFDLQEVAALLHIHEKAMGHPKLKAISDAAMKHLEEVAKATEGPEEKPEEPDHEEHDDDGKINPVERRM